MSAPLESRVAVLESSVENISQEQLRNRARLHDLESDRATLRMLTRQMQDMVGQVETIADRAAAKALEAELDKRDVDADRHRGLVMQLGALYVAVGGLAVTVIGLATHMFG